MNLKPGTYTAKVVEYGIPVTEKSPCVVLTFEVTDGEQAGGRITAYRYLTDKAAQYTLKDLITCGLKTNRVSSLTRPNAFADTEVSIVVEAETYEGKPRLKVKWINEIGGGKWVGMDTQTAEKNFAQFDSYLAGLRAEAGKPAAQAGGDFDPGF